MRVIALLALLLGGCGEGAKRCADAEWTAPSLNDAAASWWTTNTASDGERTWIGFTRSDGRFAIAEMERGKITAVKLLGYRYPQDDHNSVAVKYDGKLTVSVTGHTRSHLYCLYEGEDVADLEAGWSIPNTIQRSNYQQWVGEALFTNDDVGARWLLLQPDGDERLIAWQDRAPGGGQNQLYGLAVDDWAVFAPHPTNANTKLHFAELEWRPHEVSRLPVIYAARDGRSLRLLGVNETSITFAEIGPDDIRHKVLRYRGGDRGLRENYVLEDVGSAGEPFWSPSFYTGALVPVGRDLLRTYERDGRWYLEKIEAFAPKVLRESETGEIFPRVFEAGGVPVLLRGTYENIHDWDLSLEPIND